jgi:hypothetical protein
MGGANGSRECAPDDKLRDTHHVIGVFANAHGTFHKAMGFASVQPIYGLKK